jgi:hypothetical protein
MLNQDVCTREDLGLVTVFPPDEVGRCSALTKDFQNLSVTLRLPLMVTAHNEAIARLCT